MNPQIHRPIFENLVILGGSAGSLITRKAQMQGAKEATTEAYAAIRRKEERPKATQQMTP
jgi:hypothetical protein